MTHNFKINPAENCWYKTKILATDFAVFLAATKQL